MKRGGRAHLPPLRPPLQLLLGAPPAGQEGGRHGEGAADLAEAGAGWHRDPGAKLTEHRIDHDIHNIVYSSKRKKNKYIMCI